MAEEKLEVTEQSQISFRELHKRLDEHSLFAKDSVTTEILIMFYYGFNSIKGRTISDKASKFKFGKKSIMFGGDIAIKAKVKDERLIHLAKVGDAALRLVIVDMSKKNPELLKYPTDFYLSNYYLSRVVANDWNFIVGGRNIHDYGTYYEILVGMLQQFGSTDSVEKFLLSHFFTNQDKIHRSYQKFLERKKQ